jgi:hypothetical protein
MASPEENLAAALVNESAREEMLAAASAKLQELIARPAAVGLDTGEDLLVVMVWIKALIPQNVPGLTKPVPGAPGLTMVDAPGIPGCYLTDNRGFSPDVDASARMTSVGIFDLWNLSLSDTEYCDNTVRLDCTTGAIVCNTAASSSRMGFVNATGQSGVGVQANIVAASANPCTFGAGIIGDIDYNGLIAINTVARQVLFNGSVEPFPAFEIYAKGFTQSTSTSPPYIGVPLVNKPPNPGAGPWNLPGPANQPVSGLVTL